MTKDDKIKSVRGVPVHPVSHRFIQPSNDRISTPELRTSDRYVLGMNRVAYERELEPTLMDLPGFVDSVRWTSE